MKPFDISHRHTCLCSIISITVTCTAWEIPVQTTIGLKAPSLTHPDVSWPPIGVIPWQSHRSRGYNVTLTCRYTFLRFDTRLWRTDGRTDAYCSGSSQLMTNNVNPKRHFHACLFRDQLWPLHRVYFKFNIVLHRDTLMSRQEPDMWRSPTSVSCPSVVRPMITSRTLKEIDPFLLWNSITKLASLVWCRIRVLLRCLLVRYSGFKYKICSNNTASYSTWPQTTVVVNRARPTSRQRCCQLL